MTGFSSSLLEEILFYFMIRESHASIKRSVMDCTLNSWNKQTRGSATEVTIVNALDTIALGSAVDVGTFRQHKKEDESLSTINIFFISTKSPDLSFVHYQILHIRLSHE